MALTEQERLINLLETAFPATSEHTASIGDAGDSFPDNFGEAYRRGRRVLGSIASGDVSNLPSLTYDAWYVAGFALGQTIGNPESPPIAGALPIPWKELAGLVIRFILSRLID